ncbi:MAG: hypothetical protein K9N21_22225 [Deltaproteobacteria bacterium]|nr:hypothetical protein [Deltaproteobacteria bacterium]
MNFEELSRLMSSSFWLNDIEKLKGKLSGYHMEKKERGTLFKNIDNFLVGGKKGRALNWFIAGLLLNKGKVIKAMQRNGLFRASKYNMESRILEFVTSNALQYRENLGLSKEIVSYLKSIHTLLSLAPNVKRIEIDLIKEIKKRKKTLIKDLLATIEILFMRNYENNNEADPSEILYYSKEQICEAISYIVFLYQIFCGINISCFNNMHEDSVLKFEHSDIVLMACKIRKYYEAEIFVNYLGYTCKYENGCCVLEAATENYEKAIQHGYIYHQLHTYNVIARSSLKRSDKPASLERLAEDLYERHGRDLIKRKKEPKERFVLELPMVEPLTKI